MKASAKYLQPMSQEDVAGYAVPPLRQRSRRTAYERLALRFPEVARLLRVAFLRLPPGWRLRRELLARSIRDGMIVRLQYFDRPIEQALEAAGLKE